MLGVRPYSFLKSCHEKNNNNGSAPVSPQYYHHAIKGHEPLNQHMKIQIAFRDYYASFRCFITS
jgi:hypothetical protein